MSAFCPQSMPVATADIRSLADAFSSMRQRPVSGTRPAAGYG
jgi:hypothetical protein